MNCDNCKHYNWYYDRCNKWECEVDARAVHNCFEQWTERKVNQCADGTKQSRPH